MAELDVQRKKSNPWPWIILALLILGIIGYLVWRNSNDNNAGTTDTTMTDTAFTPAPDTGGMLPPPSDTTRQTP